MPCSESGSTASLDTGKPVKDYHGLHPYTPSGGTFTPSTRADLVAIVQMIEGKAGKAKAIGSAWSLSTAPKSDGFVIDTTGLNRHLSQPFAFPTPQAPPGTPLVGVVVWNPSRFATSAHNAPLLASLARPGFPQSGRTLIHVQAGIQIKTLLADLALVGLALPTMGAAGGQTLAGALSTATHGSDVNLSLLGDAIRAVHLIGPGGQEWWIQSNDGSGSATHYSQLPDWCHDTKVVRDTDLLQSAVVGVGRFGIIYSMVLEVVPQYLLEEQTDETTWSKTRAVLLAAVAGGYTTAGNVFADPRNGSALRHWMVFVDPASGSRAWRTRRWLTTNATTLGLEKGFDLMGFLCTHSDAAKTAAILATVTLVSILSGMIANIWAASALIPVGGPLPRLPSRHR
jgi:FAD/FMN-containing dehydrogenase